jgi:hypothetical protein
MMQEDNQGLNFSAWYALNKDHLPVDLKKVMEESHEVLRFIAEDYMPAMNLMSKALHELIREQYPVFKTEIRPIVLKRIDKIVQNRSYNLTVNTYHLIKNQEAGIDFRKKYPDLEKWKKYYCRPDPPPQLLTDKDREEYPFLDDAAWEECKEEENKGTLEFYNWKQRRKFEFKGVAQKLLFKLYKECEELDSDPLILLAVILEEEYLSYQMWAEEVESIIDYGFPAETVNMDYKEFKKMVDKVWLRKRDHINDLRNRRIAGEKI